jgi:hypothetical protein
MITNLIAGKSHFYKEHLATGGIGGNRLPAVPLLKVQVDPSVADGSHVFAATWIGVYEPKDSGANWSLLGSGLPSAVVSDIYVFPDGKVRIATYGRDAKPSPQGPVWFFQLRVH